MAQVTTAYLESLSGARQQKAAASVAACQAIQSRLAGVPVAQTDLRGRLGTLNDKVSAFAGSYPALDAFFSGSEHSIRFAFNRSVNHESEAVLEAQMEALTRRMLAIMAVMIRELENDIAAMADLLEVISVLDSEFFLYACEGIQSGKFEVPHELAHMLSLLVRKAS